MIKLSLKLLFSPSCYYVLRKSLSGLSLYLSFSFYRESQEGLTNVLDIWHFRGKFDVAKAGTLGKYFVDGDLFSLASHPG